MHDKPKVSDMPAQPADHGKTAPASHPLGLQRRGALSLMAAGMTALGLTGSTQGKPVNPLRAATGGRNVLNGDLPLDADFMLEKASPSPFDWVREGASYWLVEENGEFAIPRIGVEAEPWTWTDRRFQSNFTFAGGRILQASGKGTMPSVFDKAGRPAIMGGGPLTFQCLKPFEKWLVRFDGTVIDTNVSAQIAQTVDASRTVPLRYEFEIRMAAPPNVQDISPENFSSWGKGKQRDAVSFGLGWRFEQMLRGEGEVEVDGRLRTAKVVGSRIKRRSVRTDGLFLRGHCWQAVLFPDGRAAGFEARPVHEDGQAPWNEGFIYQNGKMHRAKATKIPWLRDIIARDEDISFELESELGTTRIEGRSELATFKLGREHLWGLRLQQSGARYSWDGVESFGMIERSSWENQTQFE